MLYTSKISQLLSFSLALSASATAIATENDPVAKRFDSSKIMDRVELVGVIADATPDSGVAVIKDTKTGRTYAIKTGDQLPGVGHIKLNSVKRELATFTAGDQIFSVRLSISGSTEQASATPESRLEDDEDLAEIDDNESPGLFSRWQEARIMKSNHGPVGEDNHAPTDESSADLATTSIIAEDFKQNPQEPKKHAPNTEAQSAPNKHR
jgi:hypothetical protein